MGKRDEISKERERGESKMAGRNGSYLTSTPANIHDPPLCPAIPPSGDLHLEFVLRDANSFKAGLQDVICKKAKC